MHLAASRCRGRRAVLGRFLVLAFVIVSTVHILIHIHNLILFLIRSVVHRVEVLINVLKQLVPSYLPVLNMVGGSVVLSLILYLLLFTLGRPAPGDSDFMIRTAFFCAVFLFGRSR
eukprot:g16875.t1